MYKDIPPTIQDPLAFVLARLAEHPLVMGTKPPALQYNARGCYICWKCQEIRLSNTFKNDNDHQASCGGKSVWVCLECGDEGEYFQCDPTGRGYHTRDKHPECCPEDKKKGVQAALEERDGTEGCASSPWSVETSSPSPSGECGASRRRRGASVRRRRREASASLCRTLTEPSSDLAKADLKRPDDTRSEAAVMTSADYKALNASSVPASPHPARTEPAEQNLDETRSASGFLTSTENNKAVMDAVALFNAAALEGNESAIASIRSCFDGSSAIPESVFNAVRLFQDWSEMGDTNAMLVLAFCYENGFGVPVDLYTSTKLVEESSWKGNMSATFKLFTLPIVLPPSAKRQCLQLEPEPESESVDLPLHPIYGIFPIPFSLSP